MTTQEDHKTENSTRRFSINRSHLKRILLFAPKRAHLLGGMSLTLLLACLNVIEPLILKNIFDSIGQDSVYQDIILSIVALLVLGLIKETTSAFSNWLAWKTRLNFHYGLLGATVERIHRLPVDVHKKEGVGAIMTRLDRGIQGFLTAINEMSLNVLPAIVYVVLAVSIMFSLSWKLALVVLIFLPIPAMLAAFAGPRQRKREKDLMDRWAKIYSRFNEVLSGIVTVRSFAMEDYEKRRFLKSVGEANEKVVNGVKFDSRMLAYQNLTINIAKVTAIGVGALLVIGGEITLGTLVAFLGYVGGLFGPVQGLTNIYKTLQTASVSLEHIFSILDTQDHLGDAPNAVEVKDLKGQVDFENIFFSYNHNGKNIVDGVSFHVNPGETIAIVGPSGSGKSTLMALLQRFYDPDFGSIKLDGMDIKTLKQKSIRRQIGVVLQDALLFNESIRDNIAYGKPDASQKEIENAAKAANAHFFIEKLDDGYNTKAGERGNRLSVGERQRVAIARALLKNPPVLILDEATSALDTELEAKVQEALENLIKNRTTFIIAHRLSTVVNADRILVFKDGNIIESGKHHELLQKNGYYASLVNRQIKGLMIDHELKVAG